MAKRLFKSGGRITLDLSVNKKAQVFKLGLFLYYNFLNKFN